MNKGIEGEFEEESTKKVSTSQNVLKEMSAQRIATMVLSGTVDKLSFSDRGRNRRPP